MRRVIFSLVGAAVLTASVNATDYEIRGEVAGLDGVTFYMMDQFTGQRIDSAVVENGQICFKGHYPQKPYVVLWNQHDGSFFACCILDSIAVVDFKKHCPIEGSQLNIAYNDFLFMFDKYSKEYAQLSDDLKTQGLTENEIEPILNKLKDKRNAELDSIACNVAINNDNGLGLVATDFYGSNKRVTPTQWDEFYKRLPAYVKGNDRINKMNELFRKKRKVMEGMPFLDFEAVDINGQPVKLSDYVGKGKYVLVDTWAPSCGPCIREGKEVLMPLYEKYKDNTAFEILGIGVIDSKDEILKALDNLRYPWTQIIDSSDLFMDMYGFSYVPMIILFAPDGTILRRDLRGAELIRRVDEVLSEVSNVDGN